MPISATLGVSLVGRRDEKARRLRGAPGAPCWLRLPARLSVLQNIGLAWYKQKQEARSRPWFLWINAASIHPSRRGGESTPVTSPLNKSIALQRWIAAVFPPFKRSVKSITNKNDIESQDKHTSAALLIYWPILLQLWQPFSISLPR